jgi:hypothetical protein
MGKIRCRRDLRNFGQRVRGSTKMRDILELYPFRGAVHHLDPATDRSQYRLDELADLSFWSSYD